METFHDDGQKGKGEERVMDGRMIMMVQERVKLRTKIIYGQSFYQVRSKQYNNHHHSHREDGEEDENHA